MKASDNPYPSLLVRESLDDGSDFTNPAADYRRLFVGEDGDLHLKDSAGAVTDFPAGGGGGGAMVLLASSVLGSAAANFDFTSISGSYNHLRIVLMGRSATAAVDDSGVLTINNDSGTNYVRELLGASATTVASAASGSPSAPGAASQLPFIAAASAGAGVAGMITIDIPCYALTTFHKVAIAQGGYVNTTALSNNRIHHTVVRWASTAAITRVTISLLSAANFATGSAAYLYGIL